jgi:hypothetical protein
VKEVFVKVIKPLKEGSLIASKPRQSNGALKKSNESSVRGGKKNSISVGRNLGSSKILGLDKPGKQKGLNIDQLDVIS